MQAIALGVDRVRTGNDGANDPILHINASMGYEPTVGSINFLKDVPAADQQRPRREAAPINLN